MLTSFKDFFEDCFFGKDRKYVDISLSKNIIQEMAIGLDTVKKPIKPDQDDIEFLKQFPPQYWTQALHQRYYHDLANALEARQTERATIEKKLRPLLKHALLTGNYTNLQGHISDDLLQKLQGDTYAHVVGNENLATKAADKLTEIESEKAIPHSNWQGSEELRNGYRKYEFKKSHRSNEVVAIVAKPYINRLIHKLERTHGQEHHPESGLHDIGQKHGLYGYDLYDLQKGDDDIPHATRGMQLPSQKEITNRMSDYLAHNAHGMYGNIDAQGDDIIWKPVGEGRTIYRDNWSWRKIYDKIFPRIMGELITAEPGSIELPDGTKVPPAKGFKILSERRAAAHKLAMKEIFSMAESGQIKGPPIPGIAPQGLPVKVKIDHNGKKHIDAPPLYLPHKKEKIRVRNADGITQTKLVDVPLVKPAEYLRQLGSEEDDDNIDPKELRGYQKDYVAVPHDDYRKAKNFIAKGAFHVNQNSSARMHIDPSDPEYQERKTQIEEEMGFTGLDKNNRPNDNGQGQYFKDIIDGIWKCINAGCGGMTDHEVKIMTDSVHDIHQMVYQKMMMNLRDPKLDTTQGRKNFAFNIASSWAQQDLGGGGGTRRLRRLQQTARDESMDDTHDGAEGGSFSIRDMIQQRLSGGINRDSGDTNRAQGEKIRPTGKHQFGYNIDNLREILKELRASANKVDNDRDNAIKLSHQEVSDQIADLIGNAIADKAELISQLKFLLTQMYLHNGFPSNEAEHFASQKIDQYGSGNAKQIIAAFEADQEVQKMMQLGQPQQLSAAVQDAMNRIEVVYQNMQSQGKMADPESQKLVYAYINSDAVTPEARPTLIADANKRFGRTTKILPKKAPLVNTEQAEADELIRKKDWLTLAKNRYFRVHEIPSYIENLIKKLEQIMTTTQNKHEQNDILDDIHDLKNLPQMKNSIRLEMIGTGAIYNGEKRQQKDYQWQGAPETAGMTQTQAQKFMNKNLVKAKKK